MMNMRGITQWNTPWKGAALFENMHSLGLKCLHVDLGSAEDGYPMSRPEVQDVLLEGAAKYDISLVALALNDLCDHGFRQACTASRTMEMAVKTAAAMGIPALQVPHFFDNMIHDDDTLYLAARNLSLLCRMAAEHGIDVYTENVLDHARLTRLWEMVDQPNLRLLFDTQNYHSMVGGDACEIIDHWSQQFGMFAHLKDGLNGLGNSCLGKGDSDFDSIFRHLMRSGYTGALVLESNYRNADEIAQDLKHIAQLAE